MGAVRLSDKMIAALACPAGRKDILLFDADLKGFGLRVTERGVRSFLYQYRAGSAVRRQRLGQWPATTASAARKMAEQIRGAALAGRDPVVETKTARQAQAATDAAAKARRKADMYKVSTLVDDWKRLHLASRSASYSLEAPRRLNAALGVSADLPVDQFDRSAAVKAVDRMAKDSGPIQANRVRAYGRACFGWAVKRGTVTENPFGTLPKAAAETSRDRVLTDAELGALWLACGQVGSSWSALVRLLILTLQRRGEVAGIAWTEVVGDLWHLPRDRTKNGLATDVPLPAAALDVLEMVDRFDGCPLVLSQGLDNPPSGFGRLKARLDAKLPADMPPWTLHDLRRTGATGLQRLGVRLEVTEAVLNHVSGSRAGIVGVYQRHGWAAEKRAALDLWAAHVLACAESASEK